MPRSEFHTRFGLLSQLDLRAFSGGSLYSRAATTVTMPTFSGIGDGLYDDAMVFLNGRGSESGQDFASQIETIWNATTGATPNVTVIINSDDKVEIEADLVFGVNALASNAVYGFDTSGQTAVLVGARYRLTAINEWQRGPISGGQMLFSVPGPGIFTAPANGQLRQDVPSFLTVATGDTLESRENAADAVVWSITNEGHAAWSSTTLAALTWLDTSFRDLLGFDGSEGVLAGAGSTYYSISTYPIAGVLVPSRPVIRQPPLDDEEAASRRTNSNGRSGVLRNVFPQHALEFHLDGPLDCKDDMSHWLKKCLPRLSVGRRITFYQDWGDSRLAAHVWDQEYSTVYTVELDGFRGRIEGWVADNSGARAMTFPSRLRRRIPLSLLIEERGLT